MKKRWKQTSIVLIVLLVIAITMFYVLEYTTYNTIETLNTYTTDETDERNYVQCLGGVLKYSKDGIALLSKNGEEIWNQACQMSHPMVEINGDTVAVADKEGRNILVFHKNGLKGEIQTAKPIEKVSVSAQGIVAAILQNEETPTVMCYDAKGNPLVEHEASLGKTGYPIDLAISDDGNVLLISYLCIDENKISTKIVYYHFGEAGEDKKDRQVSEVRYENTVIPTVTFLDKNTSLLVADNSFVIYEGLDKPEQVKRVELDKEIKSVAYNEKYIVFVLKDSGQTNYELRMYSTNGNQVMSTEIDGEYTNIKITGKQIILYAENTCAIFNDKGICKYAGIVENSIMEIFPVVGLNKYMMISANGFIEIQLAK